MYVLLGQLKFFYPLELIFRANEIFWTLLGSFLGQMKFCDHLRLIL